MMFALTFSNAEHANSRTLRMKLLAMRNAMSNNLLIINGHPSPEPTRFCTALTDAFADGARSVGWTVYLINADNLCMRAGGLDTPIAPKMAVEMVRAADRLAIVYPLWFDAPPASVQHLLSHSASWPARDCVRPGEKVARPRKAQLVVTMELPAFMHRAMLRAENGRLDARDLMSLPGLDEVHVTFVGSVGTISHQQRLQWLRDIRELGASQMPDVRKLPMRRFAEVGVFGAHAA
jgi:putative NADPH-quinone reductase